MLSKTNDCSKSFSTVKEELIVLWVFLNSKAVIFTQGHKACHLTLFVYKAHSSRTSCSYVPVTLSKTREAAENKLPNAQGRQNWRPASSRRECQQDTLALQSVSRPCPAHSPPFPCGNAGAWPGRGLRAPWSVSRAGQERPRGILVG